MKAITRTTLALTVASAAVYAQSNPPTRESCEQEQTNNMNACFQTTQPGPSLDACLSGTIDTFKTCLSHTTPPNPQPTRQACTDKLTSDLQACDANYGGPNPPPSQPVLKQKHDNCIAAATAEHQWCLSHTSDTAGALDISATTDVVDGGTTLVFNGVLTTGSNDVEYVQVVAVVPDPVTPGSTVSIAICTVHLSQVVQGMAVEIDAGSLLNGNFHAILRGTALSASQQVLGISDKVIRVNWDYRDLTADGVIDGDDYIRAVELVAEGILDASMLLEIQDYLV